MATVSLPSIISSAKNLEAGQYNHFPTFVNGLVNLLSALHTMIIFSPRNSTDLANADITVQMSQGLALLGTAQKELSQKIEKLKEASSLAQVIAEKHTEVINMSTAAKQSSDIIYEYSTKSQSTLSEMGKYLDDTKIHDKEFRSLLEENKLLQSKLSNMTEEVGKLQENSKDQQKIIESILPKGASAGLAAAFASRGTQLNMTKRIWMAIFVLAIVSLSYFAYHLTTIQLIVPGDFWKYVLCRIPLAAPLVWLGWFSAIQYGNIVRVQEDYAFKEATSKAFQGYRDHLQHLANVNIPEAGTAMNLMAAKTIEILAHEPLRIYGKAEKDASPTHRVLELFKSRKNKNDSENK